MAKGSGTTRRSGAQRSGNSSLLSSAEKKYLDVANNMANYTKKEARDVMAGVYSAAKESEIQKQYLALSANQTEEDKRNARQYARGSYDLNTALENGSKLSVAQSVLVSRLEASMKPLEKDTVVYMGWLRGNFRDTNSFKSTTLNIKTARAFFTSAGGIKAFLLPKGTKVAFGNSLEQEIILPRSFRLSKYEIK